MLDLCKEIPFLNGGLFQCLDKEINKDNPKKKERIFIDAFTNPIQNEDILTFPDYLFFAGETDASDLLNKIRSYAVDCLR